VDQDGDSRQRSAYPLNTQFWSKWLLVFALPIIVAVFYFTAVAHFNYSPDDTYIYLRFAKNMIQGNGISFNPGTPTYGFTSPMWLFIISLGGAMGIDVYMVAKVIDLLFASFALIVFYLLAHELIRDIAVAICATIAFSVNAWFMRWAGTGMETSLSVLLMLAVMLFCFRNEYFVAIVMAALLSLVRPESVLIVPIIVADVYINSLNKKRAINMAGALILVYIVILAPWLIYAYKTFGVMLPNTAFAKAGFHPGISELSATGLDIVRTIGATDGVAALMVLTGSIVLFVRRKVVDGTNGQDDAVRFFLFRQGLTGIGWVAIIIIFYLIADVNVVSRYLLIVTPVLGILAFSFLYYIVHFSSRRRYVYGIVFLLTAIMMIQNQIVYRQFVAPGLTAFEQGMENCLIPIGKWLNQNTPKDAIVVTGDIGAIGYYSEREICDAAGIISPDARVLLQQGNTADDIIGKKLYGALCTPDYVVHRASEPEKLKNDPGLEPLLSRPFVGLSLSDQRVIYYTLYQVKKASHE
jgi:arabinofuranosyltransferase